MSEARKLMSKPKAALAALIVATATMGCAAAASQPARGQPARGQAVTGQAAASQAAASQAVTSRATAHARTAHITFWSVNSDGPDFRAIVTGAVGDYGPGVTVHPDGSVDPDHTSELELNLSRGSFRLSIAQLDSQFGHAVTAWPSDRATCSIHGAVTGTVPVVAGSGTGAYRGISGSFSLTLSLDEDYIPGPACSETTPFRAQLLLAEGTGSVRL